MTALTDEEFLSTFFASPNTAWPDAEPQHPVATTLALFLESLTKRGECPLVLPRREASWPAATYYVVCWDTAHAGRMRPLLEAAVAHHWCPFDGRVAALKAEDATEASILELVGSGTTYRLRPAPQTTGSTYTAIRRLVESLRDQPLRRPNLARPIGRMLREFELALANGSAETSAELLHEIESLGGISHENLAYLQIRRLARLGQDHALLAHGSLPTIVYSEPPLLVREAVLAAWARVNLELPLTSASLPDAIVALNKAQPDVAMLVDTRLAKASDPDAIAVGALVAVARGDSDLATQLSTADSVGSIVLDGLLHTAVPEMPVGAVPALPVDEPAVGDTERDAAAIGIETEPTLSVADQPPTIDSWLAWVDQLGNPRASELGVEAVQPWAPAWTVDAALAEAIDALPQIATDALLSGVAAFLEADDSNHPAMQTAAALLGHYLVAERFSPNDLGAICILLETFLRAAPPISRYRSMLDDVRSYAPQWVAASAAARVLDIADVVTSGPGGDPDARAAFVAALLSPLHHLSHRLSPALRRLASLISSDVELDLVWTDPESASVSETSVSPLHGQILLYSLDEGCLARVQKAAELQWPTIRVHSSSDKVGSPALRQHARNASLVVMATRRAAHAATGFITESANDALIRYADGSGSASMMRAVESGLAELAG